MATETDPESTRFEDIDWDELDHGLFDLTPRALGFLASMGLLVAAFVYDYLLVPDNEVTFAFLSWDVTQLDWLFALTLVVFLFHGILPLYQNRRMTRYYWRQFRKNKAAVVSLVFLTIIFVLGTFGPVFISKPELNLLAQYQPPVFTTAPSSTMVSCLGETANGMCSGTWEYPLGTTSQGKGIMKSVIFGMRVSMQVGLITTFIIVIIGTFVGTVAAYVGGIVDEILMRWVDIQMTFPTFFLYLLLVYLFGGSLFLMIVLFGLTSWGGTARLVRSEALQRREEEYVRAADSAGASEGWIIRKHLVPNVSNTVVTNATLLIPGLILAEAALAFLQLGDPTVPSWGQVISNGRGDLDTAWWISTIPGIFLFFTILGFNFLGDALTDALDPRSEH